MTRIDFHTNIADKIGYACRLVRKARARSASCRIVLLAEPAQLQTLDQMLWTFSDTDFLPHVLAGDSLAPQTPVILTDDRDGADLPHHEMLLNLSNRTPLHFARFERMFEIISPDPTDTAAGRERYAFYKQRGYPLTHFVADQA